jgi:SAM-dependent methyltransferase
MPPTLEEDYGHYPRIEAQFQAFLDESLGPRGPDFLYEIVRRLALRPGASLLDLGCGEGAHSIRLARDFGFGVLGIDPVRRNIEVAIKALTDAAVDGTHLLEQVRFGVGAAESIPAPDSSFDFIWCKEVLMFTRLDAAFAECRRVLRPHGRMLVYQVFRTDRLEPLEAQAMFPAVATMRREHLEDAFAAAGLLAEETIDLAGEGGEHAQETTGEPGRRVVHITRFGRTAYGIMLADCLWHIYRMIGKLGARVYVLKSPN